MNYEYSVWVLRSLERAPQKVKDSVQFHTERTQREKNRNAFYRLYTYVIGGRHMMRVGWRCENGYKSYFDVYSEGIVQDCTFYIEEGYHGDLYDHESCGMSLLFQIELNKPFKTGDITLVLEEDPNPRDNLCDYYVIKPL
jgi:hypothetical protein